MKSKNTNPLYPRGSWSVSTNQIVQLSHHSHCFIYLAPRKVELLNLAKNSWKVLNRKGTQAVHRVPVHREQVNS